MPPSQEVLEAARLNPDLRIGTQFDDYAFHLGSHKTYTRKMNTKVQRVRRRYEKGTIDKSEALNQLKEIAENTKTAIRNSKGTKINDLDI